MRKLPEYDKYTYPPPPKEESLCAEMLCYFCMFWLAVIFIIYLMNKTNS